MSGLSLRLLGLPQVLQAGEPVTGFRSAKARALFYYVAASGRPSARTTLAGLFWGDLPDASANANLRKTLTNLRHLVGPSLTITRDSVGLNEANSPRLDLAEFEEALKVDDPHRWQTAVSLYRGDFLEGFYVAGAPAFETWLLAERNRLRDKLLLALYNLAQYYAGSQYTRAIQYAQRLLTLDPLREHTHRLLMSLFARSGQRARALAQYETCARILAAELDVKPGRETIELFDRIQAGELEVTGVVDPTAALHNLPAPTTSFVGRDAELARIKGWLGDANGRLLTIVGPGGVGKTRLALQAAWSALNAFAHGVWLVPLAPLAAVESAATAVAAALGISFYGQAGPENQVARFLRRRQLLLLLDNAEHLVSQPLADFITAILTQAAGVQIMVTSRHRLVMQAERVLNLPGLAYPETETAVAASDYPAGQLFLERSRNHGAAAENIPQGDTAVPRLCRLVDGLPLALELAAAWTGTLSLPAINQEIEREIAFLKANMRDLPPRHRSIRAVFDTSWQLLDAAERRRMRQLAYFRGGFTEAAAVEVAGATPAQLQALADKSLLRPQADGRYDMHELIRQYAAEKLAQQTAEEEQVALSHGRYFADFLAAREEKMLGVDYLQAKAEIQAEIENVRKAWDWMTVTDRLDDMARAAETLHYYYLNTQGLFAEAARRFQGTADKILQMYQSKKAEYLAARLWLQAAVNRRMLGQLEEAARLAKQSLAIFYQRESSLEIARASSTLSVIRLQQNDKKRALHLAETAVAQARDLGDPITLCLCLNNLSYVTSYNDQLDAAIAFAIESAALAEQNAYPHGALSAKNMLGVYYQQTGEMEKANAIFTELVEKCRLTATKSRLAQAVNNLGALHKKRGQLDRAQPLLQEAASLYEEVGQKHYATSVRLLLGEVALAQGDAVLARQLCRQALHSAQEIEMPVLTLDVLAFHAALLSYRGAYDEAVSMFTFVAHHPATLEETREKAQTALQTLPAAMLPRTKSSVSEQGKIWTVSEAISEALYFYRSLA